MRQVFHNHETPRFARYQKNSFAPILCGGNRLRPDFAELRKMNLTKFCLTLDLPHGRKTIQPARGRRNSRGVRVSTQAPHKNGPRAGHADSRRLPNDAGPNPRCQAHRTEGRQAANGNASRKVMKPRTDRHGCAGGTRPTGATERPRFFTRGIYATHPTDCSVNRRIFHRPAARAEYHRLDVARTGRPRT